MGAINTKIHGEMLLGSFIGADLNITTDQKIDLIAGNKSISRIIFANGSTSVGTAVGGIYDSASKAGSQFVPDTQAYAGLKKPKEIIATLDFEYIEELALYFSLTTAEGAAATCDIFVFGELFD